MPESIEDHLTAVLGATVVAKRRVAGGDICEAWRVELADGRIVFAKQHADGAEMFEAEAFGLRWLAEADALRIPTVLATSARVLVLEYIEPGGRTAAFDAAFGRGLAALHGHAPAGFGHERAGVLASIPQDNTPEHDWATFYGQRRLAPLVQRCIEAGRLPAEARSELDALLVVLEQRVGPAEPPARLHGDLWSGNAMADSRGEPVVYDPAPYGGHREIDLAMMRLFGGFSPACFSAYAEATPLSPGHEERVELMQLYPVLVHVALFGGHYAATARRIMRRYA